MGCRHTGPADAPVPGWHRPGGINSDARSSNVDGRAGDARRVAGRKVGHPQVAVQRTYGHEGPAVGRPTDEAKVASGAVRVVAGGGDDQAAGVQGALAGSLVEGSGGGYIRPERHGDHMTLVGDGPVDTCQDAAVNATTLIREDLTDEDIGLVSDAIAWADRGLKCPAGRSRAMSTVAVAVVGTDYAGDEGARYN